ncbi:hypothetical protein FHT78_000083 [Rhizobium sp. BK196]|uniref:hypothetical protein n=1 Tax=Rhizobium sp. BK196 TaxID=2587073 RepID=UPI001792EAF1|nr:hypothetical protein [Rhizobium sp. BK196]MBB3308354.1 hypothetical protein [Rhizobium sp. BK196]
MADSFKESSRLADASRLDSCDKHRNEGDWVWRWRPKEIGGGVELVLKTPDGKARRVDCDPEIYVKQTA